MALIKSILGKSPKWGKQEYFAENSTIIGDVEMGDYCSVWFNAVIRGDVNAIKIGHYVNVQDAAVIHCTYQKFATTIGNYVSIGHSAIVHGCTVEDEVLIGMGAIVMDGAVLGTGSIIAAGSVVLQGTKVEAGYLYAGVPAKKIKKVDQSLREGEIQRIANNYVKYASWYQEDK